MNIGMNTKYRPDTYMGIFTGKPVTSGLSTGDRPVLNDQYLWSLKRSAAVDAASAAATTTTATGCIYLPILRKPIPITQRPSGILSKGSVRAKKERIPWEVYKNDRASMDKCKVIDHRTEEFVKLLTSPHPTTGDEASQARLNIITQDNMDREMLMDTMESDFDVPFTMEERWCLV